jgi:hypothetical protein
MDDFVRQLAGIAISARRGGAAPNGDPLAQGPRSAYEKMAELPYVALMRDGWRPRILANAAA